MKTTQEQAETEVFYDYKRRSKRRNRAFELSRLEFLGFVYSDCHYCNCPPNVRDYRGEKVRLNGIDRKDSAKGYVEGNCVACCRRCNEKKNAKSYEEFKQQVKL